jgi:predicted dehydrogenase
MEYSNWIVGDMCIHLLDMVRWMLDLGWPTRVSSSGGIFVQKNVKANTTDTQTATFDFDDRDLTVVWQHRSWGAAQDRDYPWAAVFYGEKGTLKADVRKWEFTPLRSGEPLRGEWYNLAEYPEDATEEALETHVASAIRRHMRDFLAAIDSRGKPVADIEQGYISTTACILANLSQALGRSLTWDPVAGRVVGDDEANRRLLRPYREPWVHPHPENV